MPAPLPPFSCSFSPNVPELLHQLGITLALSTYQAGKVVFLSAKNEEQMSQLPRTFPKAMGIALEDNKMAIACRDEVLVLANSPQLAHHYPRKKGVYDALFMPRAKYFTGALDIHDIEWGSEGQLFAVNTLFSCLIKIDDNFSFTPVWRPPFISKMASEDRCHLNGMCMTAGRPKFVTAFSETDTPQGWRPNVTTSGIVMDVASNEIVARNLPMPHSPRLFGRELFVLLSATGELVKVDVVSGKYDVVCPLGGFVRGLAQYGDYVFVGLSKLRKSSSTFGKLKVAEQNNRAGIAIVHLPSGNTVGEIRYQNSVDEIYDVRVLPGTRRPAILNTERPEHKLGLTTPETTYWALGEMGGET